MGFNPTIVPREKLQFGLDGTIPRYWLGGDPFKTRFCDSMSTFFPAGERFFISCVRDFRDQVTDPSLQEEIRDFIRQEGQHGMIHNQFNEQLKAQGIDVDRLEGIARRTFFGIMRKYMSKEHTLASTAASEHLTSIMAKIFFERKEVMGRADPRMYALYAWHCMEEMEHRNVAFDVMQKAAKVSYLRRAYTLLEATIAFNLHMLFFTHIMLKSDGFSVSQRLKMFGKGLWWIYGVGGLFSGGIKAYLHYYKPGFHPRDENEMRCYDLWLETFNRTKDPIEAGRAVLEAAI
jgi:uncharacterized protein